MHIRKDFSRFAINYQVSTSRLLENNMEKCFSALDFGPHTGVLPAYIHCFRSCSMWIEALSVREIVSTSLQLNPTLYKNYRQLFQRN